MAATTKDTWTLEGKKVMAEIAKLARKPYVKVGYPQGQFRKPHKGTRLSVGQIAAVHEYGATIEDGFGKGIEIRVPQRSFIRATHDRKQGEWKKLTDALRKRIMAGQMTVERALGIMGVKITADMKATIKAKIPPPLRPATIAAKGSSTPLVDTGQMLNAITHKVFMGGSSGEKE